MNLPIPVPDARRREIVCNGLPLWHRAQQAVDTTCISCVTRSGELRPGADSQPGLALQQATRRKRRDTTPSHRARREAASCYSQLRFVALGFRARNFHEASCTSASCACARCRSVGLACQCGAYVSRLSGIIAVAAQRALASSLLGAPPRHRRLCRRRGGAVHEVLQDRCWLHALAPSRLPARGLGSRSYRQGKVCVKKRLLT